MYTLERVATLTCDAAGCPARLEFRTPAHCRAERLVVLASASAHRRGWAADGPGEPCHCPDHKPQVTR